MDEKCKNCEEKQACVPFFLHENAMKHKDMDNERMAEVVKEFSNVTKGQRKVNVIQSIIILLVVFIMAMFYTSRTQMWNETISKLNQTIVEVTNAKDHPTS